MENKYIPSLDGLRAVSILIVLLSHAGVSERIPGGFGVTIFFFLSGYLITTLLIREYAAFGTVGMRNFYLRRIVRLMPPLLFSLLGAVVLFMLGVVGGSLDPMTLFSQVFFFYNYFLLTGHSGSIDGIGVLWSLSIEEHFYFIWPAIFLFLMRGRIKLYHLLIFIAAITVWRSIRFFVFGDVEWTIYVSTDTRIDGLLYGCLLALLEMGPLKNLKVSPAKIYAILAFCLAMLLFSFVVRDPAFRSVLRYTVQGIALMPIFHFAVSRSELAVFRPLNWRFVRQIGLWSYAMYLCHFVIIKALERSAFVPSNPLIIAFITFILACLWSAFVYKFAEKPFHRLRKSLAGGASVANKEQ